MAELTLEALTSPLLEADPCGPDLDLADDDDYMNVLVTAETVLPPDYMVPDHEGVRQPFDQNRHYKDLDLRAQVAAALPLTERTRDLRVMMLLTKLFVLRKSLEDFGTCVAAVADLLEIYWDEVHPRAENGSLTIRREALQRLDDPLIIAGLSHVPLFSNKGFGVVTLHRYLADAKDTETAPGTATDPSYLDMRLAEGNSTDLALLVRTRDSLIPVRATLAGIKQAVARIRAACAEHMNYDVPRIEALPQLVDRLQALTFRVYAIAEGAIRRRDPSAAIDDSDDSLIAADAATEPEDAAAAPRSDQAPPPSALTDIRGATQALAAAADYFQRLEPSNPALLLVGQAQALIGKSFVEAMQMLAPDSMDRAAVRIGPGAALDLPLTRLASAAAPAGRSDGDADTDEPDRIAAVDSRSRAVALLDGVSTYFRVYEPSSPIPLLTDRARALSGKDFLSLMVEMLPKD